MHSTITRRNALTMLLGMLASGSTLSAIPGSNNTLPLRIAHDIPIAWLPFFVAHERKLWEASGLAPTIVPSTTGMATLISVSGSAADIGIAAEISVAIAAINNAPIRIIASFNQVQNMELACSVSIKGPQDLKGKRVAVAQGTPSHFYLSRLLHKYSLKPSDVSIVRLGPAEMISALGSGAIDGFVWQEPFLSQAVKLNPDKFHRLAESGLNEIFAVVMTNENTLRERRPALVRSLRALDQACAFIKANPAEALKIGATRSQMDTAVAADAISRMRFGLTMDVAAMNAKMVDEAKWAIAEGVARPDAVVPDYRIYLDPTVLAEARRA
jgi:NitT/TauT family transport system substrate-binding protein